MDALDIMQVSGAVLALMYLVRWAGVPRRWAPLLVPVLAAVGIGVWAYSHGPVTRADTFSYARAWIAVATSSAAAWGFTWTARENSRPRKSTRG